jgi:hypothetical protein
MHAKWKSSTSPLPTAESNGKKSAPDSRLPLPAATLRGDSGLASRRSSAENRCLSCRPSLAAIPERKLRAAGNAAKPHYRILTGRRPPTVMIKSQVSTNTQHWPLDRLLPSEYMLAPTAPFRWSRLPTASSICGFTLTGRRVTRAIFEQRDRPTAHVSRATGARVPRAGGC